MASSETMTLPQQQQRNDTDFSIATIPPAETNESLSTLSSPRQSNDLSYMHRPPTIMPNYGKKSRGSVLPKSNVSRVLLYDNITQQTMLGVRLNSIQSQSHKTSRELEMHMKSFIGRRKARQKALKNITRVQHHEDYLEFQREQEEQMLRQQQQQQNRFGSSGNGVSENQRIPGNGNRFLPKIGYRSSSFHTHPGQSSTDAFILRKQTQSVNGNHPNDYVSDGTLIQSETNDDKLPVELDTSPAPGNHKTHQSKSRNVESLPQIISSAPSSLAQNNKSQVDKSQPLDQDKRVGYRMVKGPKGYTRIFHALPEIDQQHSGNDSPRESGDTGLQTQNLESLVSNSFLPLRTAAQNRRFRAKQTNRRHVIKQRHNDPYLTHTESPFENENDTYMDYHPKEPLNDSRFLHLRKLLIPQQPANEGYTELSPSFPRHYPVIKDVVLNAKNKCRNKKKAHDLGRNNVEGNDDLVEDESVYDDDSHCSECSNCDENEKHLL